MFRKSAHNLGSYFVSLRQKMYTTKSQLGQFSNPVFNIEKQSSMIDQPIQITICNLLSFQKVTLVARIIEGKAEFTSHAFFFTDIEGKVDVNTTPSQGGTYTGVDGMGIIWSMEPAKNTRKGSRLSKQQASEPYTVQLGLVDGFQSINSWENLTLLCKETVDLWYMSPETDKIPIRHGRLRGTLFLPKNKSKCLGIIEMFGSAGGLIELRAALLASHGFACLALAYFAYDDLPKGFEFDLDYFDEAVEFMVQHEHVDSSLGLGLVGVSKGADIALHMASYNPAISHCVSINGSPHYNFGQHTYRGRQVRCHMHDTERLIHTDEGIICRESAKNTNNDADVIPVDQAKQARFLLLQSCDDGAVPESFVWDIATRILESGNKKCEVVTYPGAGHLLEPPYTPLCRFVYHKLLGVYLVYGGERRLHAQAQEDHWKRIVRFFKIAENEKTDAKKCITSKL